MSDTIIFLQGYTQEIVKVKIIRQHAKPLYQIYNEDTRRWRAMSANLFNNMWNRTFVSERTVIIEKRKIS